ncbi:MAG: hypothetical protein IJK89_07490 [Clostridia bacterium]|nr:hypothetical protein [Clostridia bacterium]
MTRRKAYARKVLSLVLTALMCLSVCLLDWSALVPEAEAQSNGSHSFRIQANVDDSDGDAWMSISISGIGSFSVSCGSGGWQTSTTWSSTSWPGTCSASGGTTNPDVRIYWYCQVYNNNSGGWVNIASGTWDDFRGKDGSEDRSASYSSGNVGTGGTPYVDAISWSTNNTSVTVPTSGTATLGNTAIQKDQYGVAWGGNPTYSLSSTPTGISVASSGGTGTISVTNAAKDWVSNNKDGTTYQRTLTLTATSSANSKTCTKTITFTNCQYYLDLNGYVTNEYPLNYGSSGSISGYGTVDVYNRGSRVADDVADYYTALYYGTSYSISDRKDATGMIYDGVYSGSLSGTITGATTVVLKYHKAYSTLTVKPNSGTWNNSTSDQSFTKVYGSTQSVPLPTKSYWTFTGWEKSSTFNGSGFNANAAFTYTYSTANNKTDTITATWKRDMSATYHFYAADAATDQTVKRTATVYNATTEKAFTTPSSSEAPTTVSKFDKTWTLKGWSTSATSTLLGGATAAANVGIGTSHNVSTTTATSNYAFYAVYALATTKFKANYNYYADEASSYSYQQKEKTVNGDATTGVMDVPAVTEDGANSTIARYFTKDGIVYELQGWSLTQPSALGQGTATIAYNASTATLNVPGAGTPTSNANMTPIELYPVYTQYATAIHAHFNYYTDGEAPTFLDVSGRAMGTNTSGTVKFPDSSNVATSYTKDGVTYTLVGWNAANNTEDYSPFNTSVTLAVKANPATDYYTYYPVYECTTTARYYTYTAAGARTSLTKSTTLIKYDTFRPTAMDVTVPTSGFNKTITLNGRTFTFSGWRTDTTTNQAATVATTVTSENHATRDAEYIYHAIYQNDVLALSYDTTHSGITAVPTPATQYKTQYISTSTGATASINNVAEITFDINPNGDVPAKKGYTFIGWGNNDSESETYDYAKTGVTLQTRIDKTLYARFSVNNQTVTFKYYDGSDLEGGYKTLTKQVSYDDLLRADTNSNTRYVVTAPTVKILGKDRLVNTSNIVHANDKYHLVFKEWVRTDGNDGYKAVLNPVSTEALSGTSFAAKFKNVEDDITVQATYNAFPHHYESLTNAEVQALPVRYNPDHDQTAAKDATCTADGYQFLKCVDCGHVYKKILPKFDHKDEQGNPVVTYSGYKAPTCEGTGKYATASCALCGDTVRMEDNISIQYFDIVDGAYVKVNSADGIIPAAGHVWPTVPETAPATGTDAEPLPEGVEWHAANCTENGYYLCTCANNSLHTMKVETNEETGELYEAALDHDPVVTPEVPATCTTDGMSEKSVCRRCSFVIVDSYVIPALGHNTVKVLAKAPTCEDAGNIEYYKCTNEGCGKYFTDKAGTNEIALSATVLNALGHDWVETTEQSATCTTAGHTAGIACSRCGKVQEGSSAVETRPALGHDLDDGVHHDSPSGKACVDPGYTVYTCQRDNCDYTETVYDELADHVEKEIAAVPATCTEMGKSSYKVCDVCGKVLTNYKWLPVTSHKYTVVVTPETPATCTAAGVSAKMKCANCDATIGGDPIDALGHNYSDWVITAATCEVDGSQTKFCRRCGDTVTEVIEHTGHVATETDAVPATCTEEGKTEGTVCEKCGKVLSGCEPVEMIPHDFGEYQIVREATCKLAGLKYKECSMCHFKVYEQIEKLPHTETVTKEGVSATCTAAGLTAEISCSVCGEVIQAQTSITKLEHVWQTIPQVNPTCTAKGTTAYEKCVNCQTRLSEPRDIPATGHQWGEWQLVSAATCTADGARVRYCTVEGCPAATEIKDADAQQKVLTKLGHHMSKVDAVEPACGVEGNVEYYVCSRCKGKFFKDAAGTEEYTADEIVVGALEHVWGDIVVTQPTCTEQGYTTKTCELCGATLDYDFVPANGHTGGTATCIAKAVCTVCGVPYGGYGEHNYVTEETYHAANCQERSVITKHCTVCDKVVSTTEGSYGPHHYDYDNAVMIQEPTCTQNGIFEAYCSDCGESTTFTISAMGHEDADGDGLCDDCGASMSASTDPGEASNKCDKCGKDHGGKQGGFFGYNGFICRLIAFFRMIKNLFSK